MVIRTLTETKDILRKLDTFDGKNGFYKNLCIQFTKIPDFDLYEIVQIGGGIGDTELFQWIVGH